MKVKFLEENLKVQTKENLRELRQLIKPIRLGPIDLLLGKMNDDSLGVYCFSGNESDFTKIVIFTAMRDSRMGVEICFCAYSQTEKEKEPKFRLIATKFESNPKSARNFMFKISKIMNLKFYKIVSEICKNDFIWYRPERDGFRRLQYTSKNLPLDFRLPF